MLPFLRLKDDLISGFFWAEYLSLLKDFHGVYGDFDLMRTLINCYKAMEIFENKYIYPFPLLCDLVAWASPLKKGQHIIVEGFKKVYRCLQNKKACPTDLKEKLFFPRCTQALILLRNSIILDIYENFSIPFVNRTFLESYIVIRQLLDDIRDYKADISIRKYSFVVCNGVQQAKELVRLHLEKVQGLKLLHPYFKRLLQFYVKLKV